MVAAAHPFAIVGAQRPRICVVPDGDDHPRWGEILEFLERGGIELDPWQLEILRVSLMVRPDGLWAAFVVGVCCPRQNGKNEILEARELIAALVLGEPLQIHSAHLADTSREAFRRMDERVDGNDYLRGLRKHIWRSNGHEAVEFTDRQRVRYRTRSGGSGRGFGAGVVKLDESMYLPETSEAAIIPVLSAQPNPQLWYTGSAVDQTTMEDGRVFTRVRNRALAGSADRLAYFEWSLDLANPDLVPEQFDPELVAQTNPAYGVRISEAYARAEHDALGLRAYAVERLGVGDWPDVDADGGPISVAEWMALCDPRSSIASLAALSFDVSPERNGWIGAAGPNADGRFHVEIADARPGTAWLPGRIAELAKEHRPVFVVCDERGPGASLIHAVQEKLWEVGYVLELANAAQNAQAFGVLVDAVNEQTLAHLGDERILAALRGAGTRPLSDAVTWARRSSTVDISSLVAITLALWSAAGAPANREIRIL